MRHAGGHQKFGRSYAGDRCAKRDLARDQAIGQRAHPDLIAAVADRDGAPGTGGEDVVQRCDISADVLASHVARVAVRAQAATLDGDHPVDAERPPGLDQGCNGAPGATASTGTPVNPAPANAASQAARQPDHRSAAGMARRSATTPARSTPRPPGRPSRPPEVSLAARRNRSICQRAAAA